jgi:hypothetical protein
MLAPGRPESNAPSGFNSFGDNELVTSSNRPALASLPDTGRTVFLFAEERKSALPKRIMCLLFTTCFTPGRDIANVAGQYCQMLYDSDRIKLYGVVSFKLRNLGGRY